MQNADTAKTNTTRENAHGEDCNMQVKSEDEFGNAAVVQVHPADHQIRKENKKMKSITKNSRAEGEIIVIAIIAAIIFGIVATAMIMPVYGVWKQEMNGKADLANAEWSKQIAVEEAKAEYESAKLKSMAEVERAKGVAEANAIIGDSLKDNEAYLRYLWTIGLQDDSSKVIYIPTEANLPIMEATRLSNTQNTQI